MSDVPVVRWLDALPSGESAEQLVRGDTSALPKVVFHTGVRAAIAAVSLYVVGVRDTEKLLKYSVAVAVGIEAFVLAWAAYEKQKESAK